MKKWEHILITPDTTILETIKVIDQSSLQIAIVVGENNRLLGTVTDGDIRRGILRNISLDSPVAYVMNEAPIMAKESDSPTEIFASMKLLNLKHIPAVDKDKCLIDLYTLDDILNENKRDNWVVLMAGGLGSRLRPLTDYAPKPLLKVGTKPILETILQSFVEHGFVNFYISVNYMAEQIKSYFQDGSKWGVSIRYLDETQRLGTAGALSLLPEQPTDPIFVMNGDLLTKVNFQHLLDFHNQHNYPATMCVREYEHQIPYGVIKANEHRLISIEEKPTHHFFVNAGIYVLNPRTLQLIPKNQYYDMPTLFDTLLANDSGTSIFPIREYWLDIGRMSDFEKANIEFTGEFT
jgi:dTDP-glucose pyrophosphorylase